MTDPTLYSTGESPPSAGRAFLLLTSREPSYLLSQFLSPNVNLRSDNYGGSLEGRSRIVFEMIKAIRARVNDPKFMISIKINSADFTDGVSRLPSMSRRRSFDDWCRDSRRRTRAPSPRCWRRLALT